MDKATDPKASQQSGSVLNHDEKARSGMDVLTTATLRSVEAAADSSVGKALLLPAASAIGDYWGELAKAYVQKQRTRRVENVEHHLSAFIAQGGENPFTSSINEEDFSEWMRVLPK